jgi:microcystin degradation protein MlrC
MPFVDPPAVQAAFAAGVGATIDITLGGNSTRASPASLTCKVRLLSDGLSQ